MNETDDQTSKPTNQRFTQTVDRVKSELDRLVEMAWTRGEEVIQQFSQPDSEGDWSPEIDIVETEQSLILFVNLPGVAPEDVNFSLAGNTLKITADLESLTLQNSDKVHKRGRPTGRVHRAIALPIEVENDSAVAQAERGVFKIEMKKSSNKQSRKIAVVSLDETDTE